MTSKGKKLALCKDCPESHECEQDCQEAIKFEKQDNSANYQEKGAYKAKNSISSTWMPDRQTGGLSRFK